MRLMKWVPIFALAVMGVGCGGRTVSLAVMRPASLNVRQYGGSVTVAPFMVANPTFVGEALLVQQDVRQRIVNAEAPIAQYMEAGGAVIIHGSVVDASYQERLDREGRTCSRSENGRRYNYPCTHFTRRGFAHLAVTFNVSLADGRTIFARTYENNDSDYSTAIDAQPAFIDGAAMLANIRSGLVNDFARVILPWRERVVIELEDCPDEVEQTCDQAGDHLQAGDYANAAAIYEQVLATLNAMDQTNEDVLRGTARVLYNIGLAYEYGGQFDRAVDALQRSAQLAPTEPKIQREFQSVQRLAQEQQALAEQGVIAAPPAPTN